MTNKEKMLKMFHDVHGEITGSCYIGFEYDDDENDGEVIAINVLKDGNLCWSVNKADLLFDYITKNWKGL